MPNKVITSLGAKFDKLSGKMVFMLLLAITFLIRLPFFFRDYIDRDESTFILMGQSLVDGHLPYTQLWDLKPPLIYFFFASIIYIFGKSFIAIRIAGVLAVAITAFFCFRISLQLTTKQVAFRSSVACVMLLSLFGSLQGVMSEHICMLFFMPAIYLLVTKTGHYAVFGAGLLIGLSVMTKLNMAYPALLMGCYMLYDSFKDRRERIHLSRPFLFGLGILAIIVLTWAPYYFTGKADMWWRSVILASLEYSASRRQSVLALSPIFILTGGFLVYCWRYKKLDFSNRKVQLLVLAMAGVLLSFAKGGRVNGHYLIQLHPLFIILAGIALSRIRPLASGKYLPYLLILSLMLPVESYREYYSIIKHKIERGTYFNGEGITVPQYLISNGVDTTHIIFFEYHIGYWLLGTTPPTKAATHPSNICRDEIYPFYGNPRNSSIEELSYIMHDLRPVVVVTRLNRSVFDPGEIEENLYVTKYLEEHYKVLDTVDQALIYQRLK